MNDPGSVMSLFQKDNRVTGILKIQHSTLSAKSLNIILLCRMHTSAQRQKNCPPQHHRHYCTGTHTHRYACKNRAQVEEEVLITHCMFPPKD